MKRRDFLAALGASALAPGPLEAAAARRIYMVTWRGRTEVEAGFESYLRQRGVAAELVWRDAAQDRGRLRGFLAEIRETRPDLVYTWGTPATLGIAGRYDEPLLTDVPVVFVVVAQPVATNIVPRLKGQGRDVTGVPHVAPIAAQLEAMAAYRRFKRLGVLYNSTEPNSVAVAAELRAAAASRGAQLVEATFALDAAGRPSADGVEQRIAELRAQGVQWLYLGPDTFLFTHLARVAEAAKRERLPTFATTESLIEGPPEVLAGLVSRYRSIGEFAAYKAEQVLNGGKRARDVPIEPLTRFSFVVRADVARSLDFLPPIALLNYAEMR